MCRVTGGTAEDVGQPDAPGGLSRGPTELPVSPQPQLHPRRSHVSCSVVPGERLVCSLGCAKGHVLNFVRKTFADFRRLQHSCHVGSTQFFFCHIFHFTESDKRP